jgi:hypothetical protein
MLLTPFKVISTRDVFGTQEILAQISWNGQESESECILWFVTKAQHSDNSTSRKGGSLTQPEWGIRKIMDLHHDLPGLVEKANKHMPSVMQLERDEIDKIDFAGLSDEAIEEEC